MNPSDQLPAGAASAPGQPPALAPPGFKDLPVLPGPAHPDPPSPGASQIPWSPGPDPWTAATGAAAGSSATATSTPASADGGDGDGARVSARKRRAAFRKLAEGALKAIGGLLNKGLAAGEDDTCFIPDEDDLDTIPPPIARLAARKVNVPIDDEGMSDMEDLIAAAIAVGAYAVKGLVDWLAARRAGKMPRGALLRDGDPAAAAAVQNGGPR